MDVASEGLWNWKSLAQQFVKSRECLGRGMATSPTSSATCQDEHLFLSSLGREDSTMEIYCLPKTTVQSCSATVQAVAASCRLSVCAKVCRQSVCCSGELVFDVAIAQTLEHCLPRLLAASLAPSGSQACLQCLLHSAFPYPQLGRLSRLKRACAGCPLHRGLPALCGLDCVQLSCEHAELSSGFRAGT